MNLALFDYCKARLADENRKPEYKKVTDDSFATFINNNSDGIIELQNKVQYGYHETYENYEDDFTIFSEDLEKMFAKGLSALLNDNSTNEQRLEGAKQIRNAALCGHCHARLLLGAHLLCDSSDSKDHDLGRTLLLWAGSDMKHVDIDAPWIEDILDLSVDKYPTPWMSVSDEEIDKFAKLWRVDEDGEWSHDDPIGLLFSGCNAIGSIRICCDWFEKPIEIIYKNDRMDVYVVPYLPTWYVFKCIYDKVGAGEMNDLSGVILCSEGEPYENFAPAFLYEDPQNDVRGFSQLLYNNALVSWANGFIFVNNRDDIDKLSHHFDEGNECWTVDVPASWGNPCPMDKQRIIAKHINNMLPKVAERYLPLFYEHILEGNKLPKGKCSITLIGDGSYFARTSNDGGYDITVPFTLVKMPIDIQIAFMLRPFLDDNSEEAKFSERYFQFKTYPETTFSVDYKLLSSKLKRKSLRDTYGKKMFGK